MPILSNYNISIEIFRTLKSYNKFSKYCARKKSALLLRTTNNNANITK